MRFMTFRTGGAARFGVVKGDGVVDLTARCGGEFADLKAVVAADALARVGALADAAAPDHGLDAVEFLPPIERPGKIICVGINYAKRNAEYGDAGPQQPYPNLFMRTPESLVGHRGAIIRPHVSEMLDYEIEIGLVIGRAGRYIAKDRALGHVAGVTIVNEGTLRDWLVHAKLNVTQGKNFDASGAIGPWIETAQLKPDYRFALRTWVNDELRQDDSTDNLIWRFEFIISYLSQFTTLKPGDVICTGTPTGAGNYFRPPKWLKPGDRIRMEVSGIGTLENVVADEAKA
jgi:2-keto-4-pentenoate hydratase/2-oxohepta-3-ene-1,7-dioic acid hydratase in catechol pathway